MVTILNMLFNFPNVKNFIYGFSWFFLCVSSSILYSQEKKLAVITTEFLFNGEPFSDGIKLQQSLNYAITKTDILTTLDRERLGSLQNRIQTELNIKNDFTSSFSDSLEYFGADYIAYSDVNFEYGQNYYRIITNFIKISGNSVTEKLPFITTIPHNKIQDYKYIDEFFADELKDFVDNYFLKGDDDLRNFPKIFKKIESQDSMIYYLENQLNDASDKIENLKDRLKYIKSIDIGLVIAFDTVINETIKNQKIESNWIGILSPSLAENHSLKSGERFITFSNNKLLLKKTKPNALWFQTTFSDFDMTFIDLKIESLLDFKGLLIDFNGVNVPKKSGYVKVTIVINGRSVILNKSVSYKLNKTRKNGGCVIDLTHAMVEAVNNY